MSKTYNGQGGQNDFENSILSNPIGCDGLVSSHYQSQKFSNYC